MTSGAGEEKTISVRNKLFELYDYIEASADIPADVKAMLKEKTSKLAHQVSRIHDNLEEAEKNQWGIDVAMDEIGDELYFNGVYTHEV